WVSCHVDTLTCNALTEQVCPAPFGIRQQDVAGVVDDSPVDFLWNPIVVAPVACFHVINWNSHSFRDDCRKAAVRIAENEQPVRLLGSHDLFGVVDYLTDLVAERSPLDAQEMVRRPDPEFIEEALAQVRVII